jgi:hypothetical protein
MWLHPYRDAATFELAVSLYRDAATFELAESIEMQRHYVTGEKMVAGFFLT